jgi:hypothetical protein
MAKLKAFEDEIAQIMAEEESNKWWSEVKAGWAPAVVAGAVTLLLIRMEAEGPLQLCKRVISW